MSFTLENVSGEPLPAASPGQFIVLRFATGPDHMLTRSYSLSAAPGGPYRVSIRLVPDGAASGWLESGLRVGDIVEATAARGRFTLAGGDGPIILASAGIGATPVLSMLLSLAASASERPVWWLYGTRNGRDHPFADEARTALGQLTHGHSLICYSAADPADWPGHDFDRAGHLDMTALRGLDLPRNADFYLCGPPGFMRDLSVGLAADGVDPDRIHTEAFGSADGVTPGIDGVRHRAPHRPDGDAGTGPLVSFARSGLELPWDTKYPNLLEFCEACDVPVRWACRTGVCHSCETPLVEGDVSYAPEPLDAPMTGNVLICCARPTGDLVLDL